jgi:hypothetical protein
MKKMLRRKLSLHRETVTALEPRALRDAEGGIVFTNFDCSSACFAATNADHVC